MIEVGQSTFSGLLLKLCFACRFQANIWRKKGLITFLCLFLMVGFLFSCAKVAPPLPPIIIYPDTINDLELEVGTRGPRLVFELPSSDVEHIEVYRQCPPLLVEVHSQLIARLFQDELVEANKPNKFVFEDGDPNVRDGCRYALRFVDSTGFQSGYSNFVAWLGQSIP